MKKLQAPFTVTAPDGKEYPDLKWKVQTTKGPKALCVPYIDARQVSKRLNDVLSVDGWSDTYIETNREAVICEITIHLKDGKQITRSGVGVPSEYAKEKGMASDAFKRAAVKFGIGAYIYEMGNVELPKVNYKGKIYAATEDNKALMTGEALSSYINMKSPMKSKLTEIYLSLSDADKKTNEKLFKQLWEVLKK